SPLLKPLPASGQELADRRAILVGFFHQAEDTELNQGALRNFLWLLEGRSILLSGDTKLKPETFRRFLRGHAIGQDSRAEKACEEARDAGRKLCIERARYYERANCYQKQSIPVQARMAIFDAHWLASIWRADLSSDGAVT